MKFGADAAALVGYPQVHSDAFQTVATNWDCVIAAREVGKVCTDLILEGYASKGFHVKAKSCNWGPAAGFIVEDPRFSKKGLAGLEDNLRENLQTLASYPTATTVPIYISEDRVKWLIAKNYMTVRGLGADQMHVRATSGGDNPLVMDFVLQKELGEHMWLWGVYYAEGSLAVLLGPEQQKHGLIHVRAMSDPLNTAAQGHHRAQTGDYDLFAVLPRKVGTGGHLGYEHLGIDIRPDEIGGSAHEDVHMGNISARIWMIRDDLNNEIRRAGYTGGDMVHHSDEAGRPGNPALGYPIIAWWPGGTVAYGIENEGDLKQLADEARRQGFQIELNKSWEDALQGFGDVPHWQGLPAKERAAWSPLSDPRLPRPLQH